MLVKGTLFDHVFKFIDIQCKHSGLVRTVQSHRCLQAVAKLLPCALERAKVSLCTRGREILKSEGQGEGGGQEGSQDKREEIRI